MGASFIKGAPHHFHVQLEYDRRPFVRNLVLMIPSTMVLMSFLWVVMPTDPAWMAILASIIGVAVIIFGVSPLLTYHELTEDALVLRQGWYFQLRIPLDQITSASHLERGARKVGVSFQVIGSRLSVTTRRTDLMELVLDRGIRAVWAWGKRIDRVAFDTMDNERALREIRDRSLSPVRSNGAER